MAQTEQKNQKVKKKGIIRRTLGGAYSILGFKDVVEGVGKQVENIEDAGTRSKALYNTYRDALTKKHVARNETFEEAVSRLNLSKTDLQARRKELAMASYMFMAIFAGTFYFLIIALLNGSFLNAFTLLTMCLTLGALVFSFRFRVWQIEKKRLDGPKEYINHLFGQS